MLRLDRTFISLAQLFLQFAVYLSIAFLLCNFVKFSLSDNGIFWGSEEMIEFLYCCCDLDSAIPSFTNPLLFFVKYLPASPK